MAVNSKANSKASRRSSIDLFSTRDTNAWAAVPYDWYAARAACAIENAELVGAGRMWDRVGNGEERTGWGRVGRGGGGMGIGFGGEMGLDVDGEAVGEAERRDGGLRWVVVGWGDMGWG